MFSIKIYHLPSFFDTLKLNFTYIEICFWVELSYFLVLTYETYYVEPITDSDKTSVDSEDKTNNKYIKTNKYILFYRYK